MTLQHLRGKTADISQEAAEIIVNFQLHVKLEFKGFIFLFSLDISISGIKSENEMDFSIFCTELYQDLSRAFSN